MSEVSPLKKNPTSVRGKMREMLMFLVTFSSLFSFFSSFLSHPSISYHFPPLIRPWDAEGPLATAFWFRHGPRDLPLSPIPPACKNHGCEGEPDNSTLVIPPQRGTKLQAATSERGPLVLPMSQRLSEEEERSFEVRQKQVWPSEMAAPGFVR